MSNIDGSMALGRMQADMAESTAGLSRLKDSGDRADIKKVADDFESLFLNLVLKSMRNSVQKSGLIDGGNAEDIYKSMLDDEYSKMMAAQRTTGIADQIEDFMLRAQGLDQASLAAAEQVKIAETQGLKAYQDAALHNGAKRATMELGASPRLKSE